MKKIFAILFLTCLTCVMVHAQSTTLFGKVLDADNKMPIRGLTISLKRGGNILSTTDGSFAIVLTNKVDTLFTSHAEYEQVTQEVTFNTTLPLIIYLSPMSKELEEVKVNTGYQKIAKERATGSFTIIDTKTFNEQSGTTVLDRLEAITNGLYFDRVTAGAGPKIVVRGLSTILGPRSPLIILDDFPFEGNLANINPNEVQSITILKDAAAASIWGTRAGNGVIVITTIKGRYNQKVKVDFSSNVMITQKPDLSNVKDIAPGDYVELEKFLYGKGFYNSQLTSQPWLAVTPVVEWLKQRDLGLISAADADAKIKQIGLHDLRDHFRAYVYEKGINTQQAITVTGGANNIAWNFSGGWDRNTDVLDAIYNRYNIRGGQAVKLSRRLDVTTSIDYTQSTNSAGKTGYGSLKPSSANLPVYTQLAAPDGTPLKVINRYRQKYVDTVGAGKLLDWSWYPLSDYKAIQKENKINAFLGDVGLRYAWSKALSLNVKYQYGKQIVSDETFSGMGSYFARDLVNSFSTLNRTTGQVTYRIPKGGIKDFSNGIIQTQNLRGQVNYNYVSGRHGIDGIAGAEYREIKINNTASRLYGFNADNMGFSSVDYITQFPNFITGSQSQIPDGNIVTGRLHRYVSFFGNAAYTFNKKYTLSLSGRRDASNLFGATTNNRWTPLWSTGLSWDIAKESLYKVRWLPQLKVRATYGYSGNADPLRSALTVLQYAGSSVYTQLPVASITQFNNPGLSWEKVRTINTGVDFGSVENRISGSVEYYYKRATNLFGNTPVDYTSVATNSVVKNVASIAGYGWDINVNSRNLVGIFGWTSQLNLNLNKDKVLTNYLASKQGSRFILGNSVTAVEGKPVFALYTYRWAGLDPETGDPRGYLNDTVSKNYASITGVGTLLEDMEYIGPTLPRIVASVGNTLAYKNLSLTVRIIGKFGNYFLRNSVDYGALFSMRQGHSDYALRWIKPGDEKITDVPSMVYPVNTQRNNFYRNASILASKADLIRLQYITLNYDFKKPRVQAYINANNLGLLWQANAYGIDPEFINGISPSKNFVLGIRTTF